MTPGWGDHSPLGQQGLASRSTMWFWRQSHGGYGNPQAGGQSCRGVGRGVLGRPQSGEIVMDRWEKHLAGGEWRDGLPGRAQQGAKAQSFWRMVSEGGPGWEKKLEGPEGQISQRAAFFSQRRQECTLRAWGRAYQQVQGTKNPRGRKHCIRSGLRLHTRRVPYPPLSTGPPSTLPPMNTAEHPSYPAQGTGQSSQVLEDFPRLTRKTK